MVTTVLPNMNAINNIISHILNIIYTHILNISLTILIGEEILQDWMFQTGNKSRVRYSLWLGTDRYLEKTMQLYVPTGTTFYKIMAVAAKLDKTYK